MPPRQYTVKRPSYFKRRRLPKRFFLWLFIAASIVGGGVYALFFSNLLAIDKIEYQGVVKTSTENLRATVASYLGENVLTYVPKNNVLLVSAPELEAKIRERFPSLADVSVTKKLLKSLAVAIHERIYAGVWCAATDGRTANGEWLLADKQQPVTSSPPAVSPAPFANSQCFLIDTEGIVYDRAAESSGILQFRLIGRRENLPQLGERVIEKQDLIFLRDARETLQKHFNIRVAFFETSELPDVVAETTEVWRLLLNAGRPLEEGLTALAKTLPAIDQTVERIEYIDLRVEGRVYYKTVPRAEKALVTPAP